MKKTRAAILISGRGSNMMALVEASRAPDYPAESVCVVSNRPDAAGLDFARDNGIDALTVDHKAFADRAAFEQALDAALRSRHVGLIALAGFMRVLSPAFITRWDGRILNIHPSLLPAYKGLHTHERALADHAEVHGCTVHLVTADLDAGPIILQAEVPVHPDDTPDTLSARILKEEHRIYPQALAEVALALQANTST